MAYLTTFLTSLIQGRIETPEEFANWKDDSEKGLLSQESERALFRKQLDAIALRQWKQILAWIAFCPGQVASLRDAKNQTILHHACLFFAPSQVIDFILYTAPELVSVPNEDGELALHWAIRLSTPAPILTFLLETDPDTAFRQDALGSTPIGLLWERHQSGILDTWRDTTSNDTSGLHELHAWKRILMMFQPSKKQDVVCKPSTNKFKSERMADDCDRRKEGKSSPLHAASSRPCPPGLFPLLIKVYHDEIRKRDEYGQLPLTIACKNPIANRSMDVSTKIQMLLNEYPEAATNIDTTRDNKFRRYPIFDALASTIRWEDGIGALIERTNVHPCVLRIRDPSTGLFPFALAATSNVEANRSVGENTPKQGLDQLNTVYRILRADPSVLLLSDDGRHSKVEFKK